MEPFSFTGQPDAMGGREVGDLSNQLAAHMEIASPLHRQRLKKFSNAPHIAEAEGFQAIELSDAIHAGKVKAGWIMATNPVVSSPDADKVFVPIHWNQQFSSQARVGSLIRAVLDPVSGQPESKHSIARIGPYNVNWYAFMVTRRKPELQNSSDWARSRDKIFWRYELAGQQTPDDWSEHAHMFTGTV